jgi:hypothetical protein
MSLKFAALGSLTVLSALGTPARADDKAQNLGPVGRHEPILITFGRSSSEAGSEKLEAEPPAYHLVQTQVRQCPLWVISRHDGPFASCPLYPR